MKDTGFNPKHNREQYAEKEFNETIGDYKAGIVHDENAESMGGISGHAGLFSTIKDLRNYALMIEKNEGLYEGKRILSSSVSFISKEKFHSI